MTNDATTTTASPIVRVTPPPVTTDDHLERILADLERRLEVGAPYVLLFDLSLTAPPTRTQRKLLSGHMESNADAISRFVLGMAVVVSSPLAYAVITAVLWITTSVPRYRIFTSIEEAEAWAESLLAERGARHGA